jgi:Tfp pilus assembly protein PilF
VSHKKELTLRSFELGILMGILMMGSFTVPVMHAEEYIAKLALEDGSSFRTNPLIIPSRSGVCVITGFFGSGTVTYRTAPGSIFNGVKASDTCPVTIHLKGYRTEEVTLRSSALVVLKRLGEHSEGATVSLTGLNVPKGARKAYDAGVEAMIAKKWPAAQKQFESAVVIYPKYSAAWCDLGEVLQEQAKSQEARAAYGKAIEADPKYMRPYVEFTRLELSLGRNQEAAAIANQGMEQNPLEHEPAIYFYSAVANFNLTQLDVAEKRVTKAIDLDTLQRIPRAELLLGRILFAKGDRSGAAEHMKKYVEISPKAPDSDDVKKIIARIESGSGK